MISREYPGRPFLWVMAWQSMAPLPIIISALYNLTDALTADPRMQNGSSNGRSHLSGWKPARSRGRIGQLEARMSLWKIQSNAGA